MTTTTQDHKDRVAELHDQLEAAFEAMTTGEDWRRMLEVASRFHDYSVNNMLLILWQRPDATRVAGYRKWQELGRQVRKGERSIRILAPVVRWVEADDDHGTPTRVRRVVAFKAVSVFDVAQTEGEPLPDTDRPRLLTGEAPTGLWDALAAQVVDEGFTLYWADCTPANGVTVWDTRSVTVRPDVDDAQAVKTLAHELAHVRLHEPSIVPFDHHRGLREVEAESVAYIVCHRYGLVTEGYSLPYVAHWSGGDATVVRQTAERVTACARAVFAGVDGHVDGRPVPAQAAA
jgi:antirestriction protein ArdC